MKNLKINACNLKIARTESQKLYVSFILRLYRQSLS